MSHKEEAVQIYAKHFLKLKNIPYEDRIKKAKTEAIKYVDERIKKSIGVPEDHFYWQYLKGYINKIDLSYHKNNENK